MSGDPARRRRTSILVTVIVATLVAVVAGIGAVIVATGEEREPDEPDLRLGEVADPPAPRDVRAVGAPRPVDELAGDPPSGPGDTESLSSEEQALLDMLPPTATACESAVSASIDGEVAALACVVGRGTVTYRQFDDEAAAEDYYALDSPPDIAQGGDCAEGWNRDTTWDEDGRGGPIKCYDTEDGFAVLEWLDDEVPVHGYVQSDDSDRDLARSVFEEGEAAILR